MNERDPVSIYGRARRLTNRYCWGVEQQIERLKQSEGEMTREREENRLGYANYTNKNDWEIVLVFLTRLKRCIALLKKLAPELSLDPKYSQQFDKILPKLKDMRDYEEHFDAYAIGKGQKKETLLWGHLESYEFGGDRFSNGTGELTADNARAAALVAWDAVISLEEDARKIGYLTWDDRFGPEGNFRRIQ